MLKKMLLGQVLGEEPKYEIRLACIEIIGEILEDCKSDDYDSEFFRAPVLVKKLIQVAQKDPIGACRFEALKVLKGTSFLAPARKNLLFWERTKDKEYRIRQMILENITDFGFSDYERHDFVEQSLLDQNARVRKVAESIVNKNEGDSGGEKVDYHKILLDWDINQLIRIKGLLARNIDKIMEKYTTELPEDDDSSDSLSEGEEDNDVESKDDMALKGLRDQRATHERTFF